MPAPIHDEWVLKQVGTRYRTFFPGEGDPDPDNDAGLLRPRFGLPAITHAQGTFPIEILERGGPHTLRAALLSPELSLSKEAAARCLAHGADAAHADTHTGCYPLELVLRGEEPLAKGGVGLAHYEARIPAELAQAAAGQHPGKKSSYDLYLQSDADAPTRSPRAVWLWPSDPSTQTQLSVVHLSDIHVGKHSYVTPRLLSVIADINALSPDLVVVTGDVVNRGQDPRLALEAQRLLRGIQSPVLVVLGNHDIEFFSARFHLGEEAGWPNFARAFHPYRLFKVALGGYDFIGFDSGPTVRSPRILVRGLGKEALWKLSEELDRAVHSGRRGVVLFSHAPSRARLIERGPGRGFFGRMRTGAAAFEDLLLSASTRGPRILHLSGHTHWSDVFEAREESFAIWPSARLSVPHSVSQTISSRAAIITTQAATHSGFPVKKSARGYGFTTIYLSDGDPAISFHRYGG